MRVEDKNDQRKTGREVADVVTMTPAQADAFFYRARLLTDVDRAVDAAKRARVPAQTPRKQPGQK